jgi:hypothetical protein
MISFDAFHWQFFVTTPPVTMTICHGGGRDKELSIVTGIVTGLWRYKTSLSRACHGLVTGATFIVTGIHTLYRCMPRDKGHDIEFLGGL